MMPRFIFLNCVTLIIFRDSIKNDSLRLVLVQRIPDLEQEVFAQRRQEQLDRQLERQRVEIEVAARRAELDRAKIAASSGQ
jgi:hypothetical protein